MEREVAMEQESVDKVLTLLASVVTQNKTMLDQNERLFSFIEKRDANLAARMALEIELLQLEIMRLRVWESAFHAESGISGKLGLTAEAFAEHNIKVRLGEIERAKSYAYPKAMCEPKEKP
jgi:hypothetical protein